MFSWPSGVVHPFASQHRPRFRFMVAIFLLFLDVSFLSEAAFHPSTVLIPVE